MKKILLICSLLVVAVFSTACINNLAVQDLNNKAKEYMQQGDTAQAIERLKSSLDLEPNIFETNYNLAVAYTQNEDFLKAIEQYEKAIKIKPNYAETYYSLATTQYNFASKFRNGKIQFNSEGEFVFVDKLPDIPKDEDNLEPQLSPREIEYVTELYTNCRENYNKYLSLQPNAKEKQEIETKLEKMEEEWFSDPSMK